MFQVYRAYHGKHGASLAGVMWFPCEDALQASVSTNATCRALLRAVCHLIGACRIYEAKIELDGVSVRSASVEIPDQPLSALKYTPESVAREVLAMLKELRKYER